MADSIHFPSGLGPHRGNSEYPAFLLTDVICGDSLPTQGIPLYTTPYNLHSLSRSSHYGVRAELAAVPSAWEDRKGTDIFIDL